LLAYVSNTDEEDTIRRAISLGASTPMRLTQIRTLPRIATSKPIHRTSGRLIPMRNPLLLLSLMTLSSFAHADLAGVWKGTLGKSPITVCFNAPPFEGASYYYQRFLTPIQLTQSKTGEPWVEAGNTGIWRLDAPQGDVLTGAWNKSQDSQPAPLHLERIGTSSNDRDCTSDTYNDPIDAVPPAAKIEKKSFQDHPYQVKTQGAQVTLKLEGDDPAIAKINKDLARLAISPEGQKDFYQERRNSLGNSGGVFTSELLVEPTYWSSQWITVRFYRWTAGYGINGNSWGRHTWNLKTGESVDPWSWLGGRYEWHDPYYGNIKLPAKFGAWMVKQPKGAEDQVEAEGCHAPSYSDSDLTFDAQGIKLSTRATGDGCDVELSFSWDQLQPILTAQGKAALPSLKMP